MACCSSRVHPCTLGPVYFSYSLAPFQVTATPLHVRRYAFSVHPSLPSRSRRAPLPGLTEAANTIHPPDMCSDQQGSKGAEGCKEK